MLRQAQDALRERADVRVRLPGNALDLVERPRQALGLDRLQTHQHSSALGEPQRRREAAADADDGQRARQVRQQNAEPVAAPFAHHPLLVTAGTAQAIALLYLFSFGGAANGTICIRGTFNPAGANRPPAARPPGSGRYSSMAIC